MDLMTIGAFAERSRLSPKALRRHDALRRDLAARTHRSLSALQANGHKSKASVDSNKRITTVAS